MAATNGSAVAWQPLLERLGRRYAVERMTLGRLDALCEFFQTAYADQPVASAFRDPASVVERWRWLNQDNPVSFDGDLPAWVCLKDGRIVGHFAVLPATAMVRGTPLSVCWGRDLIVAPETRRHGVGPLLIGTAVNATRRPFLIAGLNETVAPMYRRLGFVDATPRLGFVDGGGIPLYIKVYEPHRLLRTLAWPRLAQWVAAGGIRAWQGTGRWGRRGHATVPIVPLERFDERFDQWWQRVEGAFPCVIRRTSETMTWRYHRHPHHRYRAFSAMDGSRIRGIVVVRHGRSKGLPAGMISELLAAPSDREVMGALLDHAQVHLRATAKEPLAFIRCTVLHRAFQRALVRAGFLRVPSPIHWMLSHAQGRSALETLTRRADWFLNAGDSDLDVI